MFRKKPILISIGVGLFLVLAVVLVPKSFGQLKPLIDVNDLRNIFIGGDPGIEKNRLTITGSSADVSKYGFVVSNSAGKQILRIRNDGVVGFGSTTLKNPSDFTPDNPYDAYPIQAEGLRVISPGLRSFVGVSDPTSTSNVYIDNWAAIVNVSGTVTSKIVNFLNIDADIFNVGILASSVIPGVFGAESADGSFAFKDMVGVHTSTNIGLPEDLSVFGNAFISGGFFFGPVPASSGMITVSTTKLWGPWKKAIRIDSAPDLSGGGSFDKNSSIEFGGGTGGTLYGIIQTNFDMNPPFVPSLYFFNTPNEIDLDIWNFLPNVNLAISTSTVRVGNYGPLESKFALGVKGGLTYSGDTIIIKRNPNRSSIQAHEFINGTIYDSYLVLNSTSSGALYFNNFKSGDVIFGTGTSKVGVNTTSPVGLLDVAGKLKTQSLRIASGSPAAGKILVSDANGVGSWADPPLSFGSQGNTLYNNGGNWTATSNLYNTGVAIGIGTNSPQGTKTLSVVNGIAVGSYTGTSGGNIIVSSPSSIGTSTPNAILDITTSTANTLILRGKNTTGSIKIYTAYGTKGLLRCKAKSTTNAICIVGFDINGNRHNSACSDIFDVGLVNVICADFDS